MTQYWVAHCEVESSPDGPFCRAPHADKLANRCRDNTCGPFTSCSRDLDMVLPKALRSSGVPCVLVKIWLNSFCQRGPRMAASLVA